MRFSVLIVVVAVVTAGGVEAADGYALAPFGADVTIPIGHRCMGILPTRAMEVVDPLEAQGFVLLGGERPVVLLALDWCEVRNGAYEQWRRSLANAAGTDPECVLVCSLHQHDAPVVDSGAQAWLDWVGMHGELYDERFHRDCLRRVTEALSEALEAPVPVTHIGTGRAVVAEVASSRRVEHADGGIRFDRYSSSGGNLFHRTAPDGEIDPWLRTLSFWNGSEPVLALHSYATHPMSYYGRGGVSADFVGQARRLRQREQPRVRQIYVSGCSGDVTAGKYNDGTPAMRTLLAVRLYRAMCAAWEDTERVPLTHLEFRNAPFDLPFHEGEEFQRDVLLSTLRNEQAPDKERILAAMALSSLDRIAAGRKIDLPCVDFGAARLVVFPGEAFVGYQLMASRLDPSGFTMSLGYGECWPGYIPTAAAFRDGFGHGWRWVGRGSEERIEKALRQVLTP